MRKAAVSMMSSIAEGLHAASTPEFIRRLEHSRRSVAEIQAHLYIALDLEYLSQADFERLFALSESTLRQINALLAYLHGSEDHSLREIPSAYKTPLPAAPLKQPNSRHCFVCGIENPFGLGMEFYTTAPDEVTSWYTVPRRFEGYPGVVHGGIVASLVDEVVGRVHMGDEPQNARFMYTARLTVQYRNPVPVETPLRIVGHAVKRKKRTATSKAEIYAPDGTLLAEAQAILVDVPEEMLQDADLEALGWRVYP